MATGVFLFACFLNFLFYIGVDPIHDIVIVSGGQQRDSVILVSILLQTPLPPKLPCNTDQSCLCYVVGSLLVIHFKYSSVLWLQECFILL